MEFVVLARHCVTPSGRAANTSRMAVAYMSYSVYVIVLLCTALVAHFCVVRDCFLRHLYMRVLVTCVACNVRTARIVFVDALDSSVAAFVRSVSMGGLNPPMITSGPARRSPACPKVVPFPDWGERGRR